MWLSFFKKSSSLWTSPSVLPHNCAYQHFVLRSSPHLLLKLWVSVWLSSSCIDWLPAPPVQPRLLLSFTQPAHSEPCSGESRWNKTSSIPDETPTFPPITPKHRSRSLSAISHCSALGVCNEKWDLACAHVWARGCVCARFEACFVCVCVGWRIGVSESAAEAGKVRAVLRGLVWDAGVFVWCLLQKAVRKRCSAQTFSLKSQVSLSLSRSS